MQIYPMLFMTASGSCVQSCFCCTYQYAWLLWGLKCLLSESEAHVSTHLNLKKPAVRAGIESIPLHWLCRSWHRSRKCRCANVWDWLQFAFLSFLLRYWWGEWTWDGEWTDVTVPVLSGVARCLGRFCSHPENARLVQKNKWVTVCGEQKVLGSSCH